MNFADRQLRSKYILLSSPHGIGYSHLKSHTYDLTVLHTCSWVPHETLDTVPALQ